MIVPFILGLPCKRQILPDDIRQSKPISVQSKVKNFPDLLCLISPFQFRLADQRIRFSSPSFSFTGLNYPRRNQLALTTLRNLYVRVHKDFLIYRAILLVELILLIMA
jgi:hypothetical protein